MSKSARLVLALTVSLLAPSACSDEQQQQKLFLRTLKIEVRKLAAAGGGNLDLAALSNFDWEKAFVFPAYAWPDFVTEKIGFYWPGGSKSATSVQDRYQLLVFTKGTEV